MYRNLNSLAMRITAKGGLLMTCSCSGAMTQSGMFLRILRASDHPSPSPFSDIISIHNNDCVLFILFNFIYINTGYLFNVRFASLIRMLHLWPVERLQLYVKQEQGVIILLILLIQRENISPTFYFEYFEPPWLLNFVLNIHLQI